MSDAQLYAYERFWLAVHDEQAYLEGRYNKGYTKGHAKGRAEGIKQGRDEGRNDEKLDTARKMKAKGYPADDIAEITWLTVDEIGRL